MIQEFVRNKEETGSRVPLKRIDGRNRLSVAREGSAFESDAWLARVRSDAEKCALESHAVVKGVGGAAGDSDAADCLGLCGQEGGEAVQHS